ncbi:Hsp20 family protein [Bradyrhizobium sp. OAE829]|uniref:Hsp20 family protein n=1 Tax=Bradyrhizobium sp. OAE829 TaxID=2663807 RepID=UPI001789E020
MRTYDLPTLRRSTVGFDRLLNLVSDATVAEDNFPPFDVERTGENQYRISMALAGFAPQDIDITAEQSALAVEGRKVGKEDGDYLHQGISVRPFRRVFNLSEHMQVKDATFDNGLLNIVLIREIPEAMKPRRIPIVGAGNESQKTENTQAA